MIYRKGNYKMEHFLVYSNLYIQICHVSSLSKRLESIKDFLFANIMIIWFMSYIHKYRKVAPYLIYIYVIPQIINRSWIIHLFFLSPELFSLVQRICLYLYASNKFISEKEFQYIKATSRS